MYVHSVVEITCQLFSTGMYTMTWCGCLSLVFELKEVLSKYNFESYTLDHSKYHSLIRVLCLLGK